MSRQEGLSNDYKGFLIVIHQDQRRIEYMKKRSDVPRVFFFLLAFLLTLILFSVLGAEARDKFLNGSGEFVWHGWDGNDWEIFLYSNGTVTQITDNDTDDAF